MNLIVANIKWIMLVSGALTCTMIYAAIDPQAALLSMFGSTLQGPVAEIVVRNWGALITIIGGMLIYGAFNPPGRAFILTVTAVSKLIFIGLILTYGRHLLGHQAGVAVVVDSIEVVLFIVYLAASRRHQGAV